MLFDFTKLIKEYPLGRRVTVKEDGHEVKYTVSGYSFSDSRWFVAMKEGGSFLLSRLQLLEVKNETPPTVGQIMDAVKTSICSRYCKFPDCYDDEEELWTCRCAGCPLNCLK